MEEILIEDEYTTPPQTLEDWRYQEINSERVSDTLESYITRRGGYAHQLDMHINQFIL